MKMIPRQFMTSNIRFKTLSTDSVHRQKHDSLITSHITKPVAKNHQKEPISIVLNLFPTWTLIREYMSFLFFLK